MKPNQPTKTQKLWQTRRLQEYAISNWQGIKVVAMIDLILLNKQHHNIHQKQDVHKKKQSKSYKSGAFDEIL